MPSIFLLASSNMLAAPATNDVALPYAEMPLKFLYPADWMKDMYKDHSGQPIVSLGNGSYNVTQSGLYLIYSSVRVSLRFLSLKVQCVHSRSYCYCKSFTKLRCIMSTSQANCV